MPSETHLTITIPGTVSPTTLGPLRDRLEHAIQSCLGTPCDIAEGAVTLHRDDARIAGYAMLTTLRLHDVIADEFPGQLPPLKHAGRIRRLVVRLIGDAETMPRPMSVREAAERRGRELCTCMGGTADCVPPFGSSGGCSRSDDDFGDLTR